MKNFQLFFVLLTTLTLGVTNAWAEESLQVTLDFTTNSWGFPNGSSNKTATEKTYTSGDYSIILAGGGNSNGHYFNSDGYLMLGKSGATLALPAFDFNTTKIVVTGKSGASSSVKQNIYVGSDAVSTETTGATGSNTYTINASYQAAGNVYVLKVTSAHNTQITEIEVYGESNSTEPPTPATQYTIKWHTAKGVTTDVTLNEGATITKPETDPTMTGYEFMGWTEDCAVASDGTGFTAISNFGTATEDKDYYAVFAKAETTGGGGSTTGSKTLVSYSGSSFYTDGAITGVSGTNSASWTADAFTMVQKKNSSSNAVALNYAEIRVYASHSIVFTPSTGSTITSIVATATTTGYATALGGSSIANCTKSVSGSTVTITPTNGTEAITITNSAQSRLKTIVVNYTTSGGGTTTYSDYITTCASDIEFVELGDAFKWSATEAEVTIDATDNVFPTLTNTHNVPVTYSSSDATIASIAADGTVTLKKEGSVTITAKYEGGVSAGTDKEYKAKTVDYSLKVNKAPATPTDNVYVKVTSTAGITNGEYLIVYETGNVAFDGSLEALDVVNNTVEAQISSDTIAGNQYIDAATFTVDIVNGTILSASGKYIGKTANSNGLDVKTTAMTNTFAIDANGNAVITGNTAALRYNKTADQKRFRYYKDGGGSQEKIALYKKASKHTVTIATCTNGSVEASVADGAKVLSGTTITLISTPDSCYKLAAYDVYKTGDNTTKVTVTDNTFIMPEFNVTISATFESTQLATPIVSATTTYNTATLTWNAVENAEKYSVQIGTTEAVETTETSYEVTGLNADTQYTYQVRAIAADDQFDYCDSELAEGSFTTSQAPIATLILSENGETHDLDGEHRLYEIITLPNTAAACTKTFVGWSADANCTTAPEYAPGASYTLSKLTQTLYAVYATANGDETKYIKLTTTPTPSFAGTYLIVNEENQVAFNGGLETLDAVGNTISVVINDATIETSTTVDNATFDIWKNQSADNYFITSKSGKYIGRTTDANELDESTETEYTNTISIDADGNANIIGSGGAYLRYDATSGQERFSYYESTSYTSQKAIALYKKYFIPLYTNYTTYCGDDITISSGTTQTFNTAQQINTLIIEGGATANLVAGNIEINTIILKGGVNADATDYKMPILYTNGATIDVDHLYLNLAINHNTYYPFAVPFPVSVSDIDYANPTLAAASEYGTHYLIKRYDGAKRAKEGVNKDVNWVVVETDETLQPGVGYIISALTGNSETTTTIQIPLTFEPEQNSTLSIIAHTGTAAANDPIQKGWNFIAHPYLSKYAGSNINNAPRYVSIPTYNFSAYQQTMLMATTLSPEYPFFVQIGEDTEINFTTEGRRQTPASVRADENNQILNLLFNILLADKEKDQTGIILDNSCTPAYEINADLEKMFGSEFTTSIYTLCQDMRLAFNAMSFENAQSFPIPLGYRAAEAGEYTINLDIIEDASAYENLYEGIVLYDSATEIKTNLLYADYTFTTDKIQDDTRFSIQFVPKNNAPTHIENIPHYQTTQKIILNNQLYIIHNGQIYNITGQNIR